MNMSCAVNTSGQATSFSTNRIEDNEVKPGHKPLTSFFISDILNSSNKKALSSSSSSSSPPPDDDDDKKRQVADEVDFYDHKAQQLNFNFHQQLFRFHHQHRHHPLSLPHQFLFAQSSLYNSLGRGEFPAHPSHHHHHHQHQHHHHHQQQLQQRHQQHPTVTQQHLSEQQQHQQKHHKQQQRFDKKRPHQPPSPVDIKRPWDEEISRSPDEGRTNDDVIRSDEEIEVDVSSYETDDDDVGAKTSGDKIVCPLDALLRMTSQTFEQEAGSDSGNNNSSTSCSSKQNNGNNSNGGGNKKRRKSRTAFTNKQIFELEKRFVYQKYLTPVDRDDIAQTLGLTNAQVITWFQNRRAKLKRDMEELKADVIAAKTIGKEPNVLIGGIEELLQGTRESLRKKPPQKSSNHHSIVNSRGTNHDRRQMEGVYDSPRILRNQRSPSSDWSGPLRADQSEKENSDVSSVKSDDVTK